MITKFKIFEHEDIDPYGEEDWNEPKFYTIDDLKIGDDIYHIDHFYGKILSISEEYIGFIDKNDWRLDTETVLDALNEGRMKIVKR